MEGIPAIVGGVLTYFFLPGRPAEASFLTSEEKNWITTELAGEEQQKLAKRQISVLQTLASKRVWHLTAIYFPGTVGMYAMTFWMPQLINDISSTSSNTGVGVLVMIPYVVALAAMILVGKSSDKRLERRYHAAVPLIIGAMAFVLLAVAQTRSVFLSVVLWCLWYRGSNAHGVPFGLCPMNS